MSKQNGQRSTGALNTLRQTLSEDEWREALSVVKARRNGTARVEDRRDEDQPRHEVVRRCLLRVDRGDRAPGLYVCRTKDISGGGACLLHGGLIEPGSICCVIFETDAGPSLAVGGEIAWYDPIKGTSPTAYEVGIRFYQPIDAERFVGNGSADEWAA